MTPLEDDMKPENTIPLNEWLQRATPVQRATLYEQANTSRHATWQVASGRRGISANKAAQLEAATIAIHRDVPTLPPVLRTSTCEACAECPYAKKCGAV